MALELLSLDKVEGGRSVSGDKGGDEEEGEGQVGEDERMRRTRSHVGGGDGS